MHEFSIARSIVEIANEEASKHSFVGIEKIELEIGKLAGIDLHSLEFVWDAAVKNSVLEGATKVIHQIQGVGHCVTCESDFEMDQLYSVCPKCQGFYTNLVKGDELKIKSLTLKN